MTLKKKCTQIAALVCALVAAVLAQSDKKTAKVYGTVADLNQARITDAAVTLKDLATRQTLRATTNEDGEFVFDAVKPGRYELTASAFWTDEFKQSFLVEAGNDKALSIEIGPHSCPDPVKRLSASEKAKAQYCPVHRRRLQVGIVPIEYGLIVVAEYASREFLKEFPNANSVYYGGCVVDCYKQAEVLYCPACRKAEWEWRDKHGELMK